MASVVLKWLRRCLFICVCAFFFMSHNASALTPTLDLNGYSVVTTSSPQINCNFNNSSLNVTNVWSCSLPPNNYLRNIETVSNFSVQNGDVFTFDLILFSTTQLNTANGVFNYWWQAPSGYQILDINVLDNNYYHINSDSPTEYLDDGYKINQVWRLTLLRNGGNGSVPVGFGQPNQNSFYYGTPTSDVFTNLNISVRNITQWRKGESEENKEQEDATQDAADESQDAGDDSSSEAESATSGLTSVIGGFVSAVTSAQPTNCKINGKINNSFNMGELDLCSMPVPSFVQIISSLILIAICIPFAIVMFNRFIGLFRSFQG